MKKFFDFLFNCYMYIGKIIVLAVFFIIVFSCLIVYRNNKNMNISGIYSNNNVLSEKAIEKIEKAERETAVIDEEIEEIEEIEETEEEKENINNNTSNNTSNNTNNYVKNNYSEPTFVERNLSDKELIDEVKKLISGDNYNDYARELIMEMLPDYKKVFTNDEIYYLFSKLRGVELYPVGSHKGDERAYNGLGLIVVNLFENEMENNDNRIGLKWLLTHEICHSLGDFPYDGHDYSAITYFRNNFLEEGMVDTIADIIVGKNSDKKFAVKKEKDIIMYYVNDNYSIGDTFYGNYNTYTIGGNYVMLYKYVGCFDELVHSNMNRSFDGLKACFSKNVRNGEDYYNKLNKLSYDIDAYMNYPHTFYTKDELIKKHPANNEYYSRLKDINSLLIDYSKLQAEIINNKIDNTYSACEFKKAAAIYYSEDGINFKNDIKC